MKLHVTKRQKLHLKTNHMSNNVWFSKHWIFFLFIKLYILYPPFLWLCFFYTSEFSNLTTHWDHQWGCKNYWFLSLTPAILKILFNWHIGQSSQRNRAKNVYVCVCVDLLWGIGLHNYGNWEVSWSAICKLDTQQCNSSLSGKTWKPDKPRM